MTSSAHGGFSPLEQLRAVRDLRDVSSTAKAVLQALISRADDGGQCRPAYPKIAQDAGVGIRCAKATIRRLEELGHITRVRRRVDGSHENDTNQYRIHVRAAVQNDRHVVQDGHPPGDPGAPPAVHDVHDGGDPGAPKLPIELPNGTALVPLTRNGAKARQGRERSNGKTAAPPSSCPPTEIAAWCAKWGIPNPATDAEAARFLDHARSIDRRCADWAAAWRNWRQLAPRFAPGPARARPPVQPPPADGRRAWTYEDKS